jgi:hypothetical protein
MVGEQVFGRFKLVRRLGRGGMGDVWLARDDSLACHVALKFLPDAVRWDPVALAALKEETRRARQLTHPHIVRIHDFLEDDSFAAISMEYVDGPSLAAERLTRPNQTMEPAEIMVWLPQLAAALDYAHHEARLVHRDLKPANVLRTSAGLVKLSDFGVARSLGESMLRVSQLHTTGGTLLYMSPQQYFGEPATASDDIYALGATLYELLTGKPPFHTGNIAAQIERRAPESIAVRRRQFGAPSGSGVSSAWEETIAACLAKKPEDRPATAGEVVARLRESAPVASRKFMTSVSFDHLGRMTSRWVLGVGLLAAVLAGGWYYRASWLPKIGGTPLAVPAFPSDATRAYGAWNLDGDGRDASGHGLQLMGAYAVPTVDRHGRIDRAMHFNGNAALQTEETSQLGGDALEPFTVALWLRPDSDSAQGTTLLALHATGQGDAQWSLAVDTGYPLFMMCRVHDDASNDIVRAADKIRPDAWTHLVALSDGREIRLYVGGRLSARAPMTHGRSGRKANQRRLFVGQTDGLDPNKFNGDLDQIRLWKRALTAEEIAAESEPAPGPRLTLTSGNYSEKDELAETVVREFGADARLADWNELIRWHGNDSQSFVDELGFVANATSAYVQRDGKRFIDEKRQYFVTRFDGKKPDYYLAHAELGGMTLALGSWFGNKMPALATLPFVAPFKRALTARADGALGLVLQQGERPRAMALTWTQEFTAGSSSSTPVRVKLSGGSRPTVGIRFAHDDSNQFALSLGDWEKPQLSRMLSARYARLVFTLVAQKGRLHLRAVNSVGGESVFQEAVAIPDFNPYEVRELQITGVDQAEVTTER